MATLRTSSQPPDVITTQELVETLLVESGAAGEFPTNSGKMLQFLELQQLSFDFMHELDFVPAAQIQEVSKLRAALSINDKVVATHSGMGEQRRRFSVLHEVAHYILPEHREKLFLDSDQTLGFWTKARLEREANQVAADLLFQGDRFSEESLSVKMGIAPLLKLVPKYGASFEAGFRRYVERHVLPCAIIVYDKIETVEESFAEDQEYRLQYVITSPSFRQQYFSALETGGSFSAESLFKTPLYTGSIAERELIVERNSEKEAWRFDAEVFSNGYKIFQLLKRELVKPSKT